jgi:S1-C subfamily serine protease
VQVRRLSGEITQATPLSLHQPSGLAVLKTELDIPPLKMSSSVPQVGGWTVLAATRSTSEGQATLSLQPTVLSSVSASVRCHGLVHRDLITFEAPCSSGSACAPLLDTEGRAVGVLLNTMQTHAGLPCAYALPVGKLQPIVRDLLNGKSTRSGWLGLAVLHTPAEEGLEVQAVLSGSPGHKSGLRPGDTLLAIDGKSITSADVFSSRVVKAVPGSEVKVRLLREDQLRTIRATVGRRPVIISRQVRRGKACAGGGAADLTGREAARQLRELRQANQQLRRMLEGLSREVKALKKKEKDRQGGR